MGCASVGLCGCSVRAAGLLGRCLRGAWQEGMAKMGRKNWGWAMGLAVVGSVLMASGASAAVNIALVPVGNAGNANDPATGHGQVNYTYNIGKYDVTAGQYTAFLNAVAKTDTYGLYNSSMAGGFASCGISRSGSSGHYVYATTKNANFPVNYVSFWDSCRFANWLQNGQPTGAEGAGTTETGTYTLTSAGMSANTITRNTGSTWAVTSENEWYKAVYYDPTRNSETGSYWFYPVRSNTPPSNVLSATGTNNANFYTTNYTDPTNYLTPVGAFAASPSAYGTFDQGGDVWQWTESTYYGSYRIMQGGSFMPNGYNGQSGDGTYDFPTSELYEIGFRVSQIPAQVPEPASLGILGLGVVGMLVRRRGVRG